MITSDQADQIKRLSQLAVDFAALGGQYLGEQRARGTEEVSEELDRSFDRYNQARKALMAYVDFVTTGGPARDPNETCRCGHRYCEHWVDDGMTHCDGCEPAGGPEANPLVPAERDSYAAAAAGTAFHPFMPYEERPT